MKKDSYFLAPNVYSKDKTLDRQAHSSRVFITNYLADTNLERINNCKKIREN